MWAWHGGNIFLLLFLVATCLATVVSCVRYYQRRSDWPLSAPKLTRTPALVLATAAMATTFSIITVLKQMFGEEMPCVFYVLVIAGLLQGLCLVFEVRLFTLLFLFECTEHLCNMNEHRKQRAAMEKDMEREKNEARGALGGLQLQSPPHSYVKFDHAAVDATKPRPQPSPQPAPRHSPPQSPPRAASPPLTAPRQVSVQPTGSPTTELRSPTGTTFASSSLASPSDAASPSSADLSVQPTPLRRATSPNARRSLLPNPTLSPDMERLPSIEAAVNDAMPSPLAKTPSWMAARRQEGVNGVMSDSPFLPASPSRPVGSPVAAAANSTGSPAVVPLVNHFGGGPTTQTTLRRTAASNAAAANANANGVFTAPPAAIVSADTDSIVDGSDARLSGVRVVHTAVSVSPVVSRQPSNSATGGSSAPNSLADVPVGKPVLAPQRDDGKRGHSNWFVRHRALVERPFLWKWVVAWNIFLYAILIILLFTQPHSASHLYENDTYDNLECDVLRVAGLQFLWSVLACHLVLLAGGLWRLYSRFPMDGFCVKREFYLAAFVAIPAIILNLALPPSLHAGIYTELSAVAKAMAEVDSIHISNGVYYYYNNGAPAFAVDVFFAILFPFLLSLVVTESSIALAEPLNKTTNLQTEVTLQELLATKHGFASFFNFLKTEFAMQNLLYWRACSNFELGIRDHKRLLRAAATDSVTGDAGATAAHEHVIDGMMSEVGSARMTNVRLFSHVAGVHLSPRNSALSTSAGHQAALYPTTGQHAIHRPPTGQRVLGLGTTTGHGLSSDDDGGTMLPPPPRHPPGTAVSPSGGHSTGISPAIEGLDLGSAALPIRAAYVPNLQREAALAATALMRPSPARALMPNAPEASIVSLGTFPTLHIPAGSPVGPLSLVGAPVEAAGDAGASQANHLLHTLARAPLPFEQTRAHATALLERARNIFKRFVRDGALYEVSVIDGELRLAIIQFMALLESGMKSPVDQVEDIGRIFIDSQAYVLDLLETDAFPRYLRSPFLGKFMSNARAMAALRQVRQVQGMQDGRPVAAVARDAAPQAARGRVYNARVDNNADIPTPPPRRLYSPPPRAPMMPLSHAPSRDEVALDHPMVNRRVSPALSGLDGSRGGTDDATSAYATARDAARGLIAASAHHAAGVPNLSRAGSGSLSRGGHTGMIDVAGASGGGTGGGNSSSDDEFIPGRRSARSASSDDEHHAYELVPTQNSPGGGADGSNVRTPQMGMIPLTPLRSRSESTTDLAAPSAASAITPRRSRPSTDRASDHPTAPEVQLASPSSQPHTQSTPRFFLGGGAAFGANTRKQDQNDDDDDDDDGTMQMNDMTVPHLHLSPQARKYIDDSRVDDGDGVEGL